MKELKREKATNLKEDSVIEECQIITQKLGQAKKLERVEKLLIKSLNLAHEKQENLLEEMKNILQLKSI